MKNILNNFMKEESGATAIEYALLAALIGVAIIASATTLGNSIVSTFRKVGAVILKASA